VLVYAPLLRDFFFLRMRGQFKTPAERALQLIRQVALYRSNRERPVVASITRALHRQKDNVREQGFRIRKPR
jgi:hypothetical protein